MQHTVEERSLVAKLISLRKRHFFLFVTIAAALVMIIFRSGHLSVDVTPELPSVAATDTSPVIQPKPPNKWTGQAKVIQVTFKHKKTTLQHEISTTTRSVPTSALSAASQGLVHPESTVSTQPKLSTVSAQPKTSTVSSQPKMYQKALGRIGNCLFAIAAVFTLGRQTNHRPILADGFEYLNVSFPNLHMDFEKLPPDEENVRVLGEHGFSTYSPDLFTNVPQVDIVLSGYYQSFKYFKGIEDEIRTLFYFSDKLLLHADQVLHNIKDEYFSQNKHIAGNLTFIGLHIRYDDFAKQSNQDLGYTVASVAYIYRAMYYFRMRYNNTVFVLRSDSPEWCRENIIAEDLFHPSRGTAEEDLALLSRCNHTIVTVGTYSWWAGWLAGGEVAYYQPYNLTRGVGKQFEPQDFFPPEWLPLADMTRDQLKDAIQRPHR